MFGRNGAPSKGSSAPDEGNPLAALLALAVLLPSPVWPRQQESNNRILRIVRQYSANDLQPLLPHTSEVRNLVRSVLLHASGSSSSSLPLMDPDLDAKGGIIPPRAAKLSGIVGEGLSRRKALGNSYPGLSLGRAPIELLDAPLFGMSPPDPSQQGWERRFRFRARQNSVIDGHPLFPHISLPM